jgi:hypothetical protein
MNRHIVTIEFLNEDTHKTTRREWGTLELALTECLEGADTIVPGALMGVLAGVVRSVIPRSSIDDPDVEQATTQFRKSAENLWSALKALRAREIGFISGN